MKLELWYPKFPFWRAEVSRLALHLGGIEFENRHPTREEFAAWKVDGTLPFGQVPILVVDGVTIAQTGAIARFCGKLSGHYPDDPLQAALVDQFIDAATDVTNRISVTMRIKDAEAKLAARREAAETTLPTWFGFLETLTGQGENGFLVGDSLTIADIAIWRLIGWFRAGILDGIPATVVDAFPGLLAHSEVVEAYPGIKARKEANYGT